MAITYTWKVTDMKVHNQDIESTTYEKTVVQTFWEKTGTDENGNTGMFAGATPFQYNPESSTFIPFSELTEEIVIGWIQGVVVGRYEDHVNEQIQKDIDEKASQIIESVLPWGS